MHGEVSVGTDRIFREIPVLSLLRLATGLT